jgi:hypothetical protein
MSAMKRHRRIVVSAVAALSLLAAQLILFRAQPVQGLAIGGVLTGKGNTWDASVATAGGHVYVTWTGYDGLRKPTANLRVDADPRVQLNARGAGWAWSIDADTDTVAYQQVTAGDSNVRFYNWSTQSRSGPGPSVNTVRWEYEPALSGHRLLFARLNRAATPDVRRVLLADLSTGRQIELAAFRGSAQQGTIGSLQLSGDWATWTTFSQRYQRATVHRYQISTGKLTRIPPEDGWLDYLSAVAPNGTVYFLRSRFGCGRHAAFMSYSTAGVMSRVAAMPAGRNVGDEMSAGTQADGSIDLTFDSYRCGARRLNGNAYTLPVPGS